MNRKRWQMHTQVLSLKATNSENENRRRNLNVAVSDCSQRPTNEFYAETFSRRLNLLLGNGDTDEPVGSAVIAATHDDNSPFTMKRLHEI